ncbi:MAG TPA: hypothetical protein VHN99_05835, partial [Deinococcales bacterium]|nr:hypothetical protein [Deinococcales bacterium]
NLVPLVIVAVVNTVFAYYYYFRVLVQVFLAEPRDPRPVTLNPTAVTALAVALTGVIILGVFPTPLLNVIQQAAQTIPVVALR